MRPTRLAAAALTLSVPLLSVPAAAEARPRTDGKADYRDIPAEFWGSGDAPDLAQEGGETPAAPPSTPAPVAPTPGATAPIPTQPDAATGAPDRPNVAAMRAALEGQGLLPVTVTRAAFGAATTVCFDPVFAEGGDLVRPETCSGLNVLRFGDEVRGVMEHVFLTEQGELSYAPSFELVEGALCIARQEFQFSLPGAAADELAAAAQGAAADLFGGEAGVCDVYGREPDSGALRLITFRYSGQPVSQDDGYFVLMAGRPVRLSE